MVSPSLLPIPPHFEPDQVGAVWRVPYQQRAAQAKQWAIDHAISPAADDQRRCCLLIIDAQNTFCIPGFELFVGGQSGHGAVDDNRRLCEFIYRNLGAITTIVPTLDTHQAQQIFHAEFWLDADGAPPAPMTTLTLADIEAGQWQINPAMATSLALNPAQLADHALHYARQLSADGKYPLTIWPYHSMLGGIGHALVSAVEEACFFHNLARHSQTAFELKGDHPLTENYSVLRPEVMTGADGQSLGRKNTGLIQTLLTYDVVVVAGQAKSHCVAWTVDDLLQDIQAQDPALARKVFLLEDCTSPVVVPDVVDYTAAADAAYARFAAAGMGLVTSTVAVADLGRP